MMMYTCTIVIFVQEILGEQCLMYDNFMVIGETEFELEAQKFLQDGYYASNVGDIMPLAMANILHANFIIFTADPQNPLWYVTPEDTPTQETVFLVYNSSGPGHYDAALPYHKPVVPSEKRHSKLLTCSCGVNNRVEGRKSCIPLPQYSTRCRCYKNDQSCTSHCRCKDCANPHGTKCMKKPRKRIRRPHSHQLKVPNTKAFATDRGECMSTAVWSDFESIIVMEILQSYDQEDTANFTKLCNDIVYYSSSLFCACPLPHAVVFREKTISQIESKLQYVRSRTSLLQ